MMPDFRVTFVQVRALCFAGLQVAGLMFGAVALLLILAWLCGA